MRLSGCGGKQGQQHGDIRNDHLLIDPETGRHCWIDFDYEMLNPVYDIWCLGNVLTCVVGKGNLYFKDFRKKHASAPIPGEGLSMTPEDALLFFPHRISNLRKLFPYIPEKLGRLLLRFSAGTPSIPETVRAMIGEIREAFP